MTPPDSDSPPVVKRRHLMSAAATLLGMGLTKAQGESGMGHEESSHASHHGAKTPQTNPRRTAQPPVSTGKTEIFAPEGITYRPVRTPNGKTLEWKMVDGVKVYHLIAEPVTHEFIPAMEGHGNLVADCWGYNGRVHGPTIEAVEGDKVRIYVTNRLEAATTVHWHGLLVPSGMDGVGGVSQRAIKPGETFKYEFELHQFGTYMYHSHHDEMTQMQLGMMGMFVVHPKEKETAPPDHDYAILLSEWKVEVGSRRPDPNEMTDFNIFTMNGRSFPGTEPLLARTGEKVRIRLGNLSTMSHHAIHVHGFNFKVVATDGGPIPESAQYPEITVHIPTGTTRTMEFIAAAPGDWVIHCHMLHHVMNQMGHQFGNLIGIRTKGLGDSIGRFVPGFMVMGDNGMAEMGGMQMDVPPNSLPMVGGKGKHDIITMGGMFTILKVRDQLPADGSDPGWYDPPPGTLADVATAADLARDGISVGKS